MTTFQSKRVGEVSITPTNEKAVKTIAFFTEQGFSDKALLDVAKAQPGDFTVTEVDYCAMLDKPDNTADINAALLRLQLACNTGDQSKVTTAFREYDGALDAVCNPIRAKYGVSTRYTFNVIANVWARRESAPRATTAGVTVGEPIKVLTHCFVGIDGFNASDTNAQKLYAVVKAHYEPTWKVTSQTDVKHTAIPYFGKHGKYSTEVK